MNSLEEKRQNIKSVFTCNLNDLSDLYREIAETKLKYPECIIMARVGDFFESYFDDAATVSEILEIKITSKLVGKKEDDVRIPMAGVPHTTLNEKANRLLSAGYNVVVFDQIEDPKKVKGRNLKRKVVRILTPGTDTSTYLNEYKNNFLCGIYRYNEVYGVCFSDISTGEILVSSHTDIDCILNEIARFKPSEIIMDKECKDVFSSLIESKLKLKVSVFVQEYDTNMSDIMSKIDRSFNYGNISKAGYHNLSEIFALYCVLSYVEYTQCLEVNYSAKPKFYVVDNFMSLDADTRRNLELCENIIDKGSKGTLLSVLDNTKTKMGNRLLRQWIESPLRDKAQIEYRLAGVEELVSNSKKCEEIVNALSGILDISRIMGRLKVNSDSPCDLVNLRESLKKLPNLKNIMNGLYSRPLIEIERSLYTFEDLVYLLDMSLLDEPSNNLAEGLVLKSGYNTDLDRARVMLTDSDRYMNELQDKERDLTGIKNLKVTKSAGMILIEVTKANIDKVPTDRYKVEKPLKNCVKYRTEETDKLQLENANAIEHSSSLQIELYDEIRDSVKKELGKLSVLCEVLSTLDCLCSFAKCAIMNGYNKPILNNDGVLEIVDGKHPVVSVMCDDFVSNNTVIDMDSNRVLLITGPNMAGKSTYMRQTALIVLMAHLGCFVPARYANIPLTDKIFTRVGASDDISSGRSTFYVEMEEVKNILFNATKNSLVLLDEVGRGTSTSDGMAIAQAITEFLHNKIGCKTMFATHYHELILLEKSLSGLVNYHISVDRGENGSLLFLHKIESGGLSESYGIDVADLAGLPKEVISRAWSILNSLESKEVKVIDDVKKDTDMEVLEKLKSIDKGNITPLSAFKILSEILDIK